MTGSFSNQPWNVRFGPSRDSVFEIVRASFRGGMLDVAASRLLRSMVQVRKDEPDLGR